MGCSETKENTQRQYAEHKTYWKLLTERVHWWQARQMAHLSLMMVHQIASPSPTVLCPVVATWTRSIYPLHSALNSDLVTSEKESWKWTSSDIRVQWPLFNEHLSWCACKKSSYRYTLPYLQYTWERKSVLQDRIYLDIPVQSCSYCSLNLAWNGKF